MRPTLLAAALFATTLSHAQCLTFDGTDDQLQVPNIQLNAIGTGDFTVEAWVKGVEALQLEHARLFSNRESFTGFMFFFHGLWGGANYKMLTVQMDGFNYFALNNGTYNGSLLDGNCHHVAITRQTDTLFFYADGIRFGRRDIVGTPTAASPAATAVIGNDAPDPYPFNGNISELRLWNHARTEAEIQGTMDISISATTPGLVGYWPMNDNTQAIADLTGTASGQLGISPNADPYDPIWSDNCCTVSGLQVSEAAGVPVRVYGNGSGQLVVELPEAGIASISIVDALGRVVLRTTTSGKALIDVDPLAAGTYLARVDAGNTVHTARFVVDGSVR
jgi:hypothetical protein